jgi:hypothetical protein
VLLALEGIEEGWRRDGKSGRVSKVWMAKEKVGMREKMRRRNLNHLNLTKNLMTMMRRRRMKLRKARMRKASRFHVQTRT